MEKFVFSKFNYYHKSEITENYIIYNSLQRKIFKIPCSDARKIGITAMGPQTPQIKYNHVNTDIERKLVEYGIIISESFDENKEAHLKYLEEISSPVLHLTIVPTYRCNFRCPYCYQDHEHSITMSDAIQTAIIKYVKKNISKYTAVEISWFGGEPLLCFDIILKINGEIKKIFNDRILRQILECVIIESKERIKVVFVGGLEVEQELN